MRQPHFTRYHLFLFLAFLGVWVWAAVEPKYPKDWLLENLLVFLFVPIIVLAGRYFRLSNASYTLIVLFMALHLVGSHYTYSEAPFGYTLQRWFGADRNMYDRLVHFAFGLLLAYPMREMFLRVAKSGGFWGYWLPLELTLAFSAMYELIEWGVAMHVAPDTGMAFLGAQGDPWDAHKDMLLAAAGATITLLLVALARWVLDRRSGADPERAPAQTPRN